MAQDRPRTGFTSEEVELIRRNIEILELLLGRQTVLLELANQLLEAKSPLR
jgi:hypothetical protein